jgi:hypothetical protein
MSRSKSGLCLKAKATALVSATSTGVPRSSTCLDLKTAVRAGRGIRWGHVNEQVTKNELFPDLFLFFTRCCVTPMNYLHGTAIGLDSLFWACLILIVIFCTYIGTSSENMTHLYGKITLI